MWPFFNRKQHLTEATVPRKPEGVTAQVALLLSFPDQQSSAFRIDGSIPCIAHFATRCFFPRQRKNVTRGIPRAGAKGTCHLFGPIGRGVGRHICSTQNSVSKSTPRTGLERFIARGAMEYAPSS
jgi:hypothetical protein